MGRHHRGKLCCYCCCYCNVAANAAAVAKKEYDRDVLAKYSVD